MLIVLHFTSFSKLRESLLSVPVCLPRNKKETELESNFSKFFRTTRQVMHMNLQEYASRLPLMVRSPRFSSLKKSFILENLDETYVIIQVRKIQLDLFNN